MKNRLQLFVTVAILIINTVISAPAVKVITATTDFADITRQIGGNRVQVESLANGSQDLHHVEPRPSFVMKLSQADMVVRIGMDLDLWMDSLLTSSRNVRICEGGIGYVNASDNITPIEIPNGKVNGSNGDIHIYGNPHYWLDPENGKVIARNILMGLKRVDVKGAAVYQKNYDIFVKQLTDKIVVWKKQMEPLNGIKVVSYHSTWSYFYKRFGLIMVGMMENKPGIPPSGSHINDLITTMKSNKVKIVMTTSYYPDRFTDLIHRETGATVLVLPSGVGGTKEATGYLKLFDTTISQIVAVK